jgi:hypothetical protein
MVGRSTDCCCICRRDLSVNWNSADNQVASFWVPFHLVCICLILLNRWFQVSSITDWRTLRAGRVTHMVEVKNAYKSLVTKPQSNRSLGRKRCRWKDNIQLCVPPALSISISVFCINAFLCFSLYRTVTPLNSVNQLIFVTVKCGIFFAVRAEFLNII